MILSVEGAFLKFNQGFQFQDVFYAHSFLSNSKIASICKAGDCGLQTFAYH
jgi:hypothetical protein